MHSKLAPYLRFVSCAVDFMFCISLNLLCFLCVCLTVRRTLEWYPVTMVITLDSDDIRHDAMHLIMNPGQNDARYSMACICQAMLCLIHRVLTSVIQ